MCGIFGYIGNKRDASSIVVEGLKRLEYRGYDSWGVAVSTGELVVSKKAGAIGDLAVFDNLPEASIGIGHTRWATHGGVTDNNAHPHAATDGTFVLAQNGIVENYDVLKDELINKGYPFNTQTDTEVIVRLIEEERKHTKFLQDAVPKAFQKLAGRNTIILLTKDSQIIAARNGSPLVIGRNLQTKELFLSSDTLSFAPYAQQMRMVENGQMVLCDANNLELREIISGKKLPIYFEPITFSSDKVDKEGFDHFMIKEIFETPYVIAQLAKQDRKEYEALGKAISGAKTVYTIGSGTAGIAAAQIAYYLRHIGRINAINLIGADAQEYYDLFQTRDLIIAPSQSGETADVLEVLEYAKQKSISIASLVNMPGSMMTKMSDYAFMSHAGPEVCVMSTKVFTSQIAWGYLVAKTVANSYDNGIEKLDQLSVAAKSYLDDKKNHENIKDLAQILKMPKDIFLLGKSQNFQIIKEGMVKIIEASYKHAHAMPAGDLKHYAITLIEKGVPVIVAISEDEVKNDVLNAVSQVKTRGATTIGITSEDNEHFDYVLKVPELSETSAIMHVIPLQLVAYHLTLALGNNVDKPRHIAKSVTVK